MLSFQFLSTNSCNLCFLSNYASSPVQQIVVIFASFPILEVVPFNKQLQSFLSFHFASNSEKKKKTLKKENSFHALRSRDSLGNFFPNTHTASNRQPSLFFNGCELQDPLGEQPEIFEDPIGEEEEETIPPTYNMTENRNGFENRE